MLVTFRSLSCSFTVGEFDPALFFSIALRNCLVLSRFSMMHLRLHCQFGGKKVVFHKEYYQELTICKRE